MTVSATVGDVTLEFEAFGHYTEEQGGSYEDYAFEVLNIYTVDGIYFNGEDVTDKLNEDWREAVEQELIEKDN